MKKLIILIVSVFLGVNAANATYIDFASDVFKYANGETEFFTDYYGVGVTIKAHDSLNYSNYGDPDDTISWNPGPFGGVDGLGVNNDEISNRGDSTFTSEFLYVSFNSEIYVDYVDITDLFYENGYYERGSYWVETSSEWSFQQFFVQDDDTKIPSPDSNGEYKLYIQSEVVGLWFAGINDAPQHDYSIRGIEVNAPVPEPATMLLFGTGLAGLAGYRRRQEAKKK